jgi:hypothetical protein
MGVHQSKLQCMYLPAQSGKTGKMNDCIIINKRASELYGEGDLNFIITSNNIVLAEQTTTRVGSALHTKFEHDEVYSWHTGKNERSTGELYGYILDGLETITLCANGPRLKHMVDLIKRLEASHHFTKKINIWIDEADSSIGKWNKYEWVTALPSIQMITLVSATFDAIFKAYGKIFVLGYETTHPECYRCFKDCIPVEVNVVGTPVDYVNHIVTTYGLAVPGTRAFVPGGTTQASHDEIALCLKEHGFVIVIINGSRKEILIPGKPSIDLHPYISETEINSTLARLYHENHWEQHPFAITGHYCIGRGVTFQCLPSESHKGLLFTHGIIYPVTNACAAYQLMARLFGNIGGHPEFMACTVYSTQSMFSKIAKKETVAIHLAKMIYERMSDMWVNGLAVGAEEVREITDKDARCKTVPVVIGLMDEWIVEFAASNPKRKRDMIKQVILEKNTSLSEELDRYEFGQVTIPTTDNSYKKHITNLLAHVAKGSKTSIDMKDNKDRNVVNVYVDRPNKQMIVLRWKGVQMD